MSVQESKAFRYVVSKDWKYQLAGDQAKLETCPIRGCSGGHFFINVSGSSSDGLWKCMSGKCSGDNGGNLYQLIAACGDRYSNLASVKEAAMSMGQADDLPDVFAASKALLAEIEDESVENAALDYLVNERGFSMEAIEKMKLGLVTKFGRRCILYPYFSRGGKYVFAKYRTVDEPRDFFAPKGREAALYNEQILVKGIPDVTLVEGEADCVCLVSNGFENTVGVPGAALKKALWIDYLDELGLEKIFLCYDNDSAGRKGAAGLASRIGLDRCYEIKIPAVEYVIDGEIRKTKDVGEWFKYGGGTAEAFEKLKQEAKLFPIEGVTSASEALKDLIENITTNGSLKPTYDTPWPSLNQRLGGMEDGMVIGVLAPAKTGKTSLVLDWLDYLTDRYQLSSLFYCMEMSAQMLIKKWCSYITDTEDKDIQLSELEAALGVAANRPAEMLFGGHSRKIKETIEVIRSAVRRYGVKFVAVDNLQLLTTRVENQAQEISLICKSLKGLAIELGIVILLIIQPRKVDENKIANSDDAEGSSAPSKDCDAMICLHRRRTGQIKASEFEICPQLETSESFGREMLVKVDLSRFSSGGATVLDFDGAKSKITEFPSNQTPSFSQGEMQHMEYLAA